MDGALLPFDVLADVMAVLPAPSVRSLMATCKTLQSEGPKHLIRSGPVLRNVHDVLEFARFLFTHNCAYLSLLRSLDIRLGGCLPDARKPDDRADWAHSLERVLTHPSISLSKLTIDDAENLLAADRSMVASLAKLECVKRLTLRQCGVRTRYLLEQLPSRLTSADVTISSTLPSYLPPTHIQSESFRWNPIFLLRASCETLEELCWAQQDDSLSPLAQGIPGDAQLPQYPSMRQFSLLYSAESQELFDLVPRIGQFVQAYPDLSSFCIAHLPRARTSVREKQPRNEAEISRSLARIRKDNAAALRHMDQEVWPELSELSGDLRSLYSLGLTRTRPVEKLHVRDYSATMHDASMLGAVLADLRPSCLAIRVKGLAALESGDGLVSVLGLMKECTVQALHVDVALLPQDLSCNASPEDLAEAMEMTIPSLMRLPSGLSSLTLHLEHGHSSSCRGCSCSTSNRKHQALEEELEIFAQRIALLSPSLHKVVFSFAKGCIAKNAS